MKKPNFISRNLSVLLNSFRKINLKIFLILILDIAFYAVFAFVGNFFVKIVEGKAATVNLPQNLLELNQQAASNLLSTVRGFFFFLIFSIILFIVLMIVNWSLFKGLIWSLTANKKFSVDFFKKFLKLNLIWIPIWLGLITMFAIIIQQQTSYIFIFLTAILAFYFTNILYPLFLKNNKTKIKEAFSIGIKKIHHFIIPYIAIFIFAVIVSRIYSLVALSVHPYFLIGLGLLFVAWMRYCFVEILASLDQKP